MKMKLILLITFLFSGCRTIGLGHFNMPTSMIKGRVIIDAGHGGEDPGAIGNKGLLEKSVTLDVALRLKKLFKIYLPEVDVVLTRTKDQAVSLEQRVKIANKKPADIFLSLHVNSSESKSSSGFELYSLDIASDRHAERLAQRENKEKTSLDSDANFILADLRAFSYRKESDLLAKYLSRGLENQFQAKNFKQINRGYNQAIFHVLFVKMPAILAEMFFISNPQEESLLAKNNTREIMARGLLTGIYGFLINKSSRAENAK